MTDVDLREAFNPDKPVSLPNRKCAYCGVELERKTSTRDHVVARRFVPEGTLATGFFLQVKSCRPCNDRKAALEDDISIITMLPDTRGHYVRDDERLRRTVARKSKGAFSPATRRLAAQSYNKIDASVPIGGGVSMTYSGLAMPTLEDQRVARLAYYHVQGFTHFRSYDVERGHGRWLEPGEFLAIGHLTKEDWGNPRITAFAAATRSWEPVCTAVLADGYFRHEMRRKPDSELASWAVEWNGRYRVFGLYGPVGERDAFVAALPDEQVDFAWGDTTNGFAWRAETPIADEDDQLFDLPDDWDDRPFATPHWRRPKP